MRKALARLVIRLARRRTVGHAPTSGILVGAPHTSSWDWVATMGFGRTFQPTGDVGSDVDVVRAFYADKLGIRPGLRTEARLREQDPPSGPLQSRPQVT